MMEDTLKEIEDINKILETNEAYISSLKERKATLQSKLGNKEEIEPEEKKEEIEHLDSDEKSPEEWEREQLQLLKEKEIKFSSRQRTLSLGNDKIDILRNMIKPVDKSINLDKLKNSNIIINGATPITVSNDNMVKLREAITPKKESVVEQVLDDSILDSLIPTVKAATM
ncbi:MAG: hypothetical protein IJI43_03265 [Bacilli bacterium]|nr:hypothetical protein [Bacilli bacterium]